MVDFKNDLKNMMIADLSNSGITVDATLSIHDLFIGYWNILRRTIAIKPREVKVSVELLSKITGDPIRAVSF
jgi:hypothetical protein